MRAYRDPLWLYVPSSGDTDPGGRSAVTRRHVADRPRKRSGWVQIAVHGSYLTPRDVAKGLGHADPGLTMGTYMSKIVGGTRAADALDVALKY